MSKTYDKQCLELAKSFLSDSDLPADKIPGLAHLLALEIQQTIEDFIEDHHEANK